MWAKISLSPEFPLVVCMLLFFGVWFLLWLGFKMIEVYQQRKIFSLLNALRNGGHEMSSDKAILSALGMVTPPDDALAGTGVASDHMKRMVDVANVLSRQQRAFVGNLNSLLFIRESAGIQRQNAVNIQALAGQIDAEVMAFEFAAEEAVAEGLAGAKGLKNSAAKTTAPLPEASTPPESTQAPIASLEISATHLALPDDGENAFNEADALAHLNASPYLHLGDPALKNAGSISEVSPQQRGSLQKILTARCSGQNASDADRKLLKFLCDLQE